MGCACNKKNQQLQDKQILEKFTKTSFLSNNWILIIIIILIIIVLLYLYGRSAL